MKFTVYKGNDIKVVGRHEAKNLVANDGWSYDAKQPSATSKKPRAKVKVDADVLKVDSPFNDGEPLNIDLGEINEENE